MAQAQVFPSRIDAWLAVVLLLAMAAALASVFVSAGAGTLVGWTAAVLTALIGVGLPLWLLLATRYTLQGDALLVQSGPFRWRVPLAEIRSVTPTSNPLSSPALSLQRLRIDYGRGRWLMISPRDREQFLQALEAARGGRS